MFLFFLILSWQTDLSLGSISFPVKSPEPQSDGSLLIQLVPYGVNF